MQDRCKSRRQLASELAELKNRLSELEARGSCGCLSAASPREKDPGLAAPSRPSSPAERPGECNSAYITLAECLKDGIYVLDTDGRFTYVNQMVIDRSGFPRDWYNGKTFYDIIKSEHHDWARRNLAAAFKGEAVPPYELSYLSASGKEIWVEVNVTPLMEKGRVTALLGVSRDISWRKAAEEELARHREHLEHLVAAKTAEVGESERRYRELINTAPIGVFQSTPKGDLIFANETCAHMFDFESPEALLSTHPSLACSKSGDRRTIIRALQRTGSIRNHETVFLTGAGRPVSVLLSAALKDGVVSGMMVDISERKKTEKDLEKEREVFFTILENDPGGIVLIGNDGEYQYVNPEFTFITGYTLEDVPTGRVWLEKAYPDPDYRREVIRVWKENRLPKGRSLDVEFGIRCKDGTNKDIEFRTTHLENGTITVLNDITRRKAVERALYESEEKYRSIFENAMEGIFQTTPDGRFLSVNPTLARIYGYESPEELMKSVTNIGRQMYVNPEDRIQLKDLYKKQGYVEKFETQLFRKDGSKVWISMSAHTVVDSDGRALHYEGTIEDISTRKEKEAVEAQLRQSQKMEALGTLAGGIAHDFNNILIGIIGLSEILLDDAEPGTPTHRKLELIFKSSKRGYDLVRQILAFSRKSETDKKPVGMVSLIREVTGLLRATVPRTIEIRENILTADDTVLVDQGQIHQVLLNLCTNGVHAIGRRNGVIEVGLSDEQPDPDENPLGKADPGKSYVRLSVSDTGCGMSKEVMERIFDPFFTTRDEGTGMGLSVVHGIVTGHDGLISVKSRPRKGSVFSIFLPRHALKPSPLADLPVDTLHGQGRILLVDDEEIVTEMGKERLERLGYTVTASTDSTKGLDLFRGDPFAFDLIITDYSMPGMTGTDLAREVRRIREDMPVILCAGLDETVPAKKMKESGIRAFLVKPVLRDDLARQVHLVMKETAARRPPSDGKDRTGD